MPKIINNVRDRRRGFVGSWEVEPLIYDQLGPSDVGRPVIYRNVGVAEVGILTCWRNGLVWARYTAGSTAAGARPENMFFGLTALDTAEAILQALRSEGTPA